jgi:hypothetical protein
MTPYLTVVTGSPLADFTQAKARFGDLGAALN